MNIVRKDFPFFEYHKELAFLDSAASTQKPKKVIDKLKDIYSYNYANIHRGIYNLSAKLTDDFEKVRDKTSKYINADSNKEIIFTKNATEAINLVAHSYGTDILTAGDEVLISAMEHHSNIVPWQQICKEKQANLKIIPITNDGQISLDELQNMLSNKTRIISLIHMSNVFGTVIDIKTIAKLAKKLGAKLLVDACQSIAHMKIDVQNLDCDFLVFSSHKLYGPTGVGILYGKQDLLNKMKPYQTGGSMISTVTFDKTKFLAPPHKFEAGTPAIAEVIAFGEALQYMKEIDLESIWANEKKLAKYIRNEIRKLENFKILGNDNESCIISILHNKAHHSDIGDILNQCNVAIRTGHHCTQPLMDNLNISGTARISLGMYNNSDDADRLISALKKVNQLL
ncbi:MAG: SufS family cysteine desulfurase [Rickettsiales bacterium]|nr:SufS family cysteine desulfurase [Rickettsiales bacterium]